MEMKAARARFYVRSHNVPVRCFCLRIVARFYRAADMISSRRVKARRRYVANRRRAADGAFYAG